MKVLGINASPRGSRSETLKLVKAVLNGAKSAGASVELVDLCRRRIEYCKACTVCFQKGRCVKKDDFQPLYEKILATDGLVMGSPNYFRSVTAQMKTLIDRMADAIHCQLLTGKYAVNVATSGDPQQDRKVTDYLNETMLNFGAFITGSVGTSIRLGSRALRDAEKEAFELGKKMVGDIETGKVYAGQRKRMEKNRRYFHSLVKMYGKEWPHEYEYWNRISRG